MKLILKIISIYLNALSWISPKAYTKQAFHLFAFPFKAKLKDAHQEFLNTSEKFDLFVDGERIQGYKWGYGSEFILFVHGWQSNSYRWKSYIQAFDQTRYTLYSFDAPGHGNSEGRYCSVPHYEKTIAAFIAAKGRVDHFIGHSIGSFSCASFMFHHKYPVKSYTSLASPYSAREFTDDFKRRLKLRAKAYEYLEDYFHSFTGHPISHYSLDNFTRGIEAKRILIIHDKQDRDTSFENAIKMNDHLCESNCVVELVLTDGIYHNLRSVEVVDRVVEFVGQEVEVVG